MNTCIRAINAINWSGLENAYHDNSTKVGELLKEVYLKKDNETFKKLNDCIGEDLIHQGTIYPATVKILPFIFDLFDKAPSEEQIRMTRFIAGVAEGVHQYLSFCEDLENLPDELNFIQECSEILLQNTKLFKTLLTCTLDQVRMITPFIIDKLITMPAIVAPELQAIKLRQEVFQDVVNNYQNEANRFVRCSYVFLLKTIAYRNQEALSKLTDFKNAETDNLTNIFLALALSEHQQYEKSYPILSASLQNIPETDALYNNELMWFYGRLRFQIVNALCKYPDNYYSLLMRPFLHVIAHANKHTVEIEVAPILRFVFRGRKLSLSRAKVSLSEEERLIMQAILSSNLVGIDSGNASLAYKMSIGIENRIDVWRNLLNEGNF